MRHKMHEENDRRRPFDLSIGQEYWLYTTERSYSTLLVEGPGSDIGEALSREQLESLKACCTCLEARVHVASAEYWRQPSSAQSIKLMQTMGFDTCGHESFLFINNLVAAGAPRGTWMRVVIEDKTLAAAVLSETDGEEDKKEPAAASILAVRSSD